MKRKINGNCYLGFRGSGAFGFKCHSGPTVPSSQGPLEQINMGIRRGW